MVAADPTAPPRPVALIGAGQIAATHAAALVRRRDLRIVAVVDPVRVRAERLARSCGAAALFGSPEELRASGLCRAAHVLVPPSAHRSAAEPLLAAGIDCLVEKPLAASSADARALEDVAARAGAVLGCDQNYLFHPAFRRLQRTLAAGRLGRIRHVAAVFHMPLRQLEAGQTGHWMFKSALNLLLEQAVHPLSLLDALLGPLQLLDARPGPPRALGPGRDLVTSWQLALQGERGTAQLAFAVGTRWPIWQMVLACTDGTARLDLVDGRFERLEPTRYHEAVDRFLRSSGTALGLLAESARDLLAVTRFQLGRGPRPDAFFATIAGAVDAFHDALAARSAGPLAAARGRRLVELCEAIAAAAPAHATTSRPLAPRASGERPRPDVLLVGGTGFIGRATVAAMLASGRAVAVLARSITDPPPPLDDPRVVLHCGDVRDPDALARALRGVRAVVNLAHAGGAEEPSEIERAIVGGAETLWNAAATAGVGRLVQVSSIAALYLGDPAAVVTGATPVDTDPGRAPYARAKALAETRLRELAAAGGPELVILRPGLVVGEGTSPLHPGLGNFNRPQHCSGWNRGDNPLPFVLVEDVAAAIVAAIDTPGIGGRAYNLVGPIRPSARAFLDDLARALGRPVRFHPQPVWRQQAVELGKWAIKRIGGRRVPLPSLRDLRSRGLAARFDTSDAERELGWRPVADPETFRARAILVHASDHA
ncbi:MAG: NAD-dependent epimerase/dehydratase family protein [Geminicoccaceae bacterium]|nr:NAD-dependent epimerase/dehydratase family protein [Geminicoccaceae bacterium]